MNIHGANVINHDRLIDRLKRLQPEAVLVLDNLDLARMIKQILPDSTVIFREFEKGKKIHEVFNPEEMLDNHLSQGEGGIVIHIGNEMPFTAAVLDWLLKVCKRAVEKNVTVCIGNWAVGNPQPGDWPMAHELLTFAGNNPKHVIVGIHEYAGGCITSGLYGGYPDNAGVQPGKSGGKNLIQPENWPTDISGITCYHMARYKFMLDYCKKVGIKPPRIIVTEAGFDDTSDIKPWLETLKKTPPHQNVRGWRSLVKQWEAWYGNRGWSAERAYAEQMIHSDKYFYNDPAIEGRCDFCYAQSSDEWGPFNTEDAIEFWDLVIQYAQTPDTLPEPIPTPHPVPPFPGDSRYERAIFKSTGANTILREYPSVTARDLARIVAEEVRFIPAAKLTEDEKHHDQLENGDFAFWLPTVLHNLIGYVRDDVVEILPLPTLPPIEPEPELPPDTILEQDVAFLKALIAETQKELTPAQEQLDHYSHIVARLHQRIQGLHLVIADLEKFIVSKAA
jgi:hypothetical protein